MTLEEFTSNPQALKEVCEFVAGNRALYEFALKKNLSYFELHGWIKADRDRDAAYLKACLACVDARKDAIIHELQAIAAFNVQQLYAEDGLLLAVKDWPPHVAKAVAYYDIVEVMAGKGADAVPLQIKKIRPADKLRALELLGKTMAMFVEKVENPGLASIADELSRLRREKMRQSEALELLNFLADCRRNPLKFTELAYPWGTAAVDGSEGPRGWERELLIDLGEQLEKGKVAGGVIARHAVSSGHGIGKSTTVAHIANWALSTSEDTRGIITAGTEQQLATKTWPELAKWNRLCVARHLFELEATSLHSKDKGHERTWRIDRVTWSEHNTEAFQGLHNKGKRIVLLFDEASAIGDKIWEVCEGALTDEGTEIIWLAFGNPTKGIGAFRECFGKRRHRWTGRMIDSRTVEGTNKELFQQLVDDYGEDSDIVRVRVRGMPPKQSSLQFIGSDLIHEAQQREARSNIDDPLIMALDIARGGEDNCVFRFRRGLDARTIPAVRIPGSEVRDSMILVSKTLELLEEHKPDAFFYDGTGVGGPVGDRIRQLGYPVIQVQFGAKSPIERCANMRAYMYAKLLEWLRDGGAIDSSFELEQDLGGIQYSHNMKDQLLLERKELMRERGLPSPDDGDALAMTFAAHVAKRPDGYVPGFVRRGPREKPQVATVDWDPRE